MIKMSEHGIEQLKRHEGFRDHVYRCSAGFKTLGYGHNIDANPLTPYQQESWDIDPKGTAEALLRTDLEKFERALSAKKPWVADFCQPRIDALINLTFNMGSGWLSSWPNTWRVIQMGQWRKVANAIRKSKYARQVKGRATELAMQLETGVYAKK